jgi:hypothetical protein
VLICFIIILSLLLQLCFPSLGWTFLACVMPLLDDSWENLYSQYTSAGRQFTTSNAGAIAMSIGCIDAGKPPSFESEVLFPP